MQLCRAFIENEVALVCEMFIIS